MLIAPADTPLHVAIKNRDVVLAETLIQNGAEIDLKNSEGFTPLHQACRAKSLALVQLLLEHGADPNQADHYRRTVLQVALGFSKIEIIDALLKAGANVHHQEDSKLQNNNSDQKVVFRQVETGNTLLHYAVKHGNLAIVKKMLDYGANPNMVNDWKKTALHTACQKENMAVVHLLLTYDYTQEQTTPSNVVASTVRTDKLESQHHVHPNNHKKCSILINAWDHNKESALWMAVRLRHRTLTQLLLEHGADPFQRNLTGKTLLEIQPPEEFVTLLRTAMIQREQQTLLQSDTEPPFLSGQRRRM